MESSLELKIILVSISWLPGFVIGTLLYPESTIMQLTGSVSIPITPLPLKRRAFFDWGLQMNYNMPFNLSSFYMAPIWASRNNEISKRQTNENDYDFNPLEFYRSLESIIESYGFDKSCWKRSICELARHPFERIDDNWLIDLVTFVMTPSQFKIISAHEAEEQPNPYNLAEHLGRSGKLCHHLYPKCKNDPLNMLTIVFE